jgi:hypothetical protein
MKLMATYRTSKSYVPSAGFNGSVSRERKVVETANPPASRTEPQSPIDRPAEDYDNNLRRDWRRGGGVGQAEGKTGFDHYRDRSK